MVLTPQLMFRLSCILIHFLPEPKEPTKKIGSPRIATPNIVLAIALIVAMFQIPWRQVPDVVHNCQPLFHPPLFTRTPSYSVFCQAWRTPSTSCPLNFYSSLPNQATKRLRLITPGKKWVWQPVEIAKMGESEAE